MGLYTFVPESPQGNQFEGRGFYLDYHNRPSESPIQDHKLPFGLKGFTIERSAREKHQTFRTESYGVFYRDYPANEEKMTQILWNWDRDQKYVLGVIIDKNSKSFAKSSPTDSGWRFFELRGFIVKGDDGQPKKIFLRKE